MAVGRAVGQTLKKISQRRKTMKRAGFFAGMTVALLAVFGVQPSQAMMVAPNPLPADAAVLATEVQGNQQFRRNNNNNRNANRNRGNNNNRNANRNNNNRQNANRNNNNRQNANRNNNRNNNANRNNNRNSNRNFNNNRNRNVNVNVRVNTRPVRGWSRRPHFGTVVAGVTLGTIIAASAVPIAPASNLCWYWTDSSFRRGYWDFCF
jgi:hypothetical protein